MRRYGATELVRGGRIVGTSRTCSDIHRAVRSGGISGFRYITKGSERLDQLAARQYGDGTLWWLLAASSGIGWGPQVPAGTVIFIPTDLGQMLSFTG